jgi:hypothetical protein
LGRLALICVAFTLAVLAVGVIARAPTAQTTPEACRSGGGPIPAAALPETVELEDCPIGGRVITDNGVATVLPAPGQGVYVESLTTGGSQELEVTRYRDGTVELEHVGEEPEAAQTRSSIAAAARRSSECSDRARKDENWRVTAVLDYSFNQSTTPPELDPDAAEGEINAGGTNITSVRNNCGLQDKVTAELTYLGDTNSTADISGNNCDLDNDGDNVVSFGDLPRGTLATTCIWFVSNPSDYDEVTESDIKINKVDSRWTVNPRPRSCRKEYDLQSVMTHEWGHTFGLGHVSESRHGKLTMSPFIGACQKSERTLGRGDVIGLNRKYL